MKRFRKINQVILLVLVVIQVTYYLVPRSSFAADSLIKVLQAKGWIESDYRSEEIFFLGKEADPNFEFFPIQTSRASNGSVIGPFPFANTLITAFFVKIDRPELLIYFCGLLFCAYLLLLYKITDRVFVPTLAALATPLYHHFIGFSDVAFAALSILVSFYLISESEYLKNGENESTGPQTKENAGSPPPNDKTFFRGDWKTIGAGCLFGASCWFRPEALLLFVSCCAGFFLIRNGSSRFDPGKLKFLIRLVLGFSVPFVLFMIFNSVQYGSVLGSRISSESNRSIFEFDPLKKLSDIKSLLFFGNQRIGFFGFSPWYLLLIVPFLLRWSRIRFFDKVLTLAFCLNLASVSILTPNDSNIDWGSRYLTCGATVLFLLSANWNDVLLERPKLKLAIRVLFAILISYSLIVNVKAVRTLREISIRLARIQSEIPWKDYDVIVTGQLNIANTFGLFYLTHSIFYVRNGRDLERIVRRIDEKKILLVEDDRNPVLTDRIGGIPGDPRKIVVLKREPGNLLRLSELIP
ncbi:hypothetical protein CH379_013495 [Leptospira ellisii]|uniref:Uncharacterized protein n=1 Tax=Leptospira ellisii TaxID=2023197 RepID=A0AAE4QQE7_9LEPT|nr:hypothetical protein [Leptospira ellisii]MDV6236639.1 hypothetical protein [Leptospira ellisii]